MKILDHYSKVRQHKPSWFDLLISANLCEVWVSLDKSIETRAGLIEFVIYYVFFSHVFTKTFPKSESKSRISLPSLSLSTKMFSMHKDKNKMPWTMLSIKTLPNCKNVNSASDVLKERLWFSQVSQLKNDFNWPNHYNYELENHTDFLFLGQCPIQ